MRFISLLLLGLCGVCSRPWSVCEVILVPYVDAVTVMCVLLFLFHVGMLRECKVVGNAGVGDGGGVVVVSAWHEYVGGTRGSGIVSSSADVLGMREVSGVD